MQKLSFTLAYLTCVCDGKRLFPVFSPTSAFQAPGAAGPVAKARGSAAAHQKIPADQLRPVDALFNALNSDEDAAFAAAAVGAVATARGVAAKMGGAEELCGVLPDDVCKEIYDDADAVFTVIDEDGDGSITVTELTNHLAKAGYSNQAIETIFAKLDTDKDGELTREELQQGFLNFAPLREAPGLGAYNAKFVDEIHEDADSLFNMVDMDGNGSISSEELRTHLTGFSNYSDEAIDKLFTMLDVNEDGGIEREEMRTAFVKHSALRQAIGQGPSFK